VSGEPEETKERRKEFEEEITKDALQNLKQIVKAELTTTLYTHSGILERSVKSVKWEERHIFNRIVLDLMEESLKELQERYSKN